VGLLGLVRIVDEAAMRGIRDSLGIAAVPAVHPAWHNLRVTRPLHWQDCSVSSNTFTASRPNRQAVWRQIRALRSDPPGRAGKGDRKRVFGSALEQAEQLLTAAGAVGYASRPILLFYGLSQVGRAIAAASTAADNNSYKLSGHGIKTLDLDQRPPLPALTVKDDGLGSFTQLAQLLGSVSLPKATPLGQLWATIPELLTTSLEPGPMQHLPVLQLQEVHRTIRVKQRNEAWIVGLPPRPGGYRTGSITEEEMSAILSSYPTLAGSRPPFHEEIGLKDRDDFLDRSTVRALPSDTYPDDVLDQPYRDDRDRWVFPPVDDRGKPLHPLLAWWALLFALSMLARYEPASWISALDTDASPNAVPLEAALDHALDTCPELILHAIFAAAC
jgi:YaaC-like Protein